jgi:hypothetical protein
MNDSTALLQQNLQNNLHRDGEERLATPEGERGGGDVLFAVATVERLMLFNGIPPLMTPASHSWTSA